MNSVAESGEVGFEESLAARVVESGKCLGCGACVVACPFECLGYLDEKPVLVKECVVCGMCAKVCPQYSEHLSGLENAVFGRERKTEEEFGVYRRLVIAQAKDDRILSVSQDGGVVTALLLCALEKGLIDSAIVSGISAVKPFLPVPRLVTVSKEILECAGTRYFYSPNVLALADCCKRKKQNVAFVGLPCQIRAIRKMQVAGLEKCIGSLKFLVGLLCSECFTYEGLMEKHIHGKLGVDLDGIRKMNIKGKLLVTTESGVQAIPLAEVKQYVRKSCHFCSDFGSELADISVGGLGLDRWTFAVIRTERGEELFSGAEKAGVVRTRDVSEEAGALSLLRKLSVKKRQFSL